MKKGKLLKILAFILCLVLLLCLGIAFWLPSFIMTGERQTLKEAFDWQSQHYDTSFYEKLKKTDYTIKGLEDYDLHIEYLENPTKTDKYIILSHGYTDNRMGALKYVPMYLKFGFNCIIYDLRGHGENDPTFTTYGIREAQDLKALIEDTKKKISQAHHLGTPWRILRRCHHYH